MSQNIGRQDQFDGINNCITEDVTILVSDGRIECIATGDTNVPGGTQRAGLLDTDPRQQYQRPVCDHHHYRTCQ